MIRYALLITNFQLLKKKPQTVAFAGGFDGCPEQTYSIPGYWHRQKYIDFPDIGRTSDKTSIFSFLQSVQKCPVSKSTDLHVSH